VKPVPADDTRRIMSRIGVLEVQRSAGTGWR
jgi:hypothetical protein